MTTVTTSTGKYTPGYLGAVQRTLAAHLDEKHVSIKAFGAVGDGSTDDTAAFLKLRDYCVAAQDAAVSAGRAVPHFVVDLPHGHYKYQKPHWLRLIRSIEINGNGSTLQSYGLASPVHSFNVVTLGNGLAFYLNTDNAVIISNPPELSELAPTHLFDSANVGDTSITLSTEADAAEYSAGDTIFLSGLPRQHGGYMLNVHAFEWVKIADITGAVLTLDRKLRHNYLSSWADHSDSYWPPFGAARVLNCSRADFVFPDRIIINDVTFLGSPNVSYGDSVQLQGWHVQYNRCRAGDDACPIHLFSNVSEEIDCDFTTGRHEFDKCVNVCRSIRTTRKNYAQGVGTKNMLIQGSTSLAPITLSSERVTIEDSVIVCGSGAAFRPYGSNYAVRQYTAKRNRLIGADSVTSFGVHSLTVPAVSGTDIVLQGLGESYLASFCVGTSIWKWQDSSQKRGIITSVWHNGSYWVLSGTWDTPEVGDVWYTSSLRDLDARDNTDADGAVIPIGKPCSWALHGGWVNVSSDTIGTATIYQMPLCGVIDEIHVDVIRPYTGSDTVANLFVQREGPLATIATINVKEAGRRSFTQWAASGQLSGDSSTLTNMADWVGGLRIVQTGDSGYYGGSGSELPRYVIRFRGRATVYQ